MTLRTCSGTGCERRQDCARYRDRRDYSHGEKYPTPPYRYVRVIGADGRPMNASQQVCEAFARWEAPAS